MKSVTHGLAIALATLMAFALGGCTILEEYQNSLDDLKPATTMRLLQAGDSWTFEDTVVTTIDDGTPQANVTQRKVSIVQKTDGQGLPRLAMFQESLEPNDAFPEEYDLFTQDAQHPAIELVGNIDPNGTFSARTGTLYPGTYDAGDKFTMQLDVLDELVDFQMTVTGPALITVAGAERPAWNLTLEEYSDPQQIVEDAWIEMKIDPDLGYPGVIVSHTVVPDFNGMRIESTSYSEMIATTVTP